MCILNCSVNIKIIKKKKLLNKLHTCYRATFLNSHSAEILLILIFFIKYYKLFFKNNTN